MFQLKKCSNAIQRGVLQNEAISKTNRILDQINQLLAYQGVSMVVLQFLFLQCAVVVVAVVVAAVAVVVIVFVLCCYRRCNPYHRPFLLVG